MNKVVPGDYLSALSFVISHGYAVIFLIMVFEGPVITTAAAFASSLGLFNVYLILLLALLGDITGDLVFYSLGRWGRHSILERYWRFAGIKTGTIQHIESKLHRHFAKTFAVIKFTPILATPGLVIMGILKVPLKKFVVYSAIITLPRSVFFTALGFYAGVAAVNVTRYLKLAAYVPFAILILAIASYYSLKKIFDWYNRRRGRAAKTRFLN